MDGRDPLEPVPDRVPIPDPTKLTTDAVNAATDQWRRDLKGVLDQVETRLDGMDRATALRLEGINRVPAEIVAAVDTLKALHQEKFDSLALQLTLVEQQRIEQKADTKVAVDAALSAQKEAVREQTIASGLSIAKSEAATTKQLDQQSVTFGTAITGVTTTVTDLKERISNTDSRQQLYMSREEGNALVANLSGRIQSNSERVNGLELRLTSRLDLTAGKSQGETTAGVTHRTEIGLYISAISIVLTVIIATITILLTLHK